MVCLQLFTDHVTVVNHRGGESNAIKGGVSVLEVRHGVVSAPEVGEEAVYVFAHVCRGMSRVHRNGRGDLANERVAPALLIGLRRSIQKSTLSSMSSR